MSRARIKLSSINIEKLNELCSSIKEISSRAGVVMRGPVTLPTKRLKITTRKSPCGEGKASFDRWEMRIYKRLIDLPVNESVLHSIMRIAIPREVSIKIEVVD